MPLLSRWYLLYLGIILIVFGIAGLVAAGEIRGPKGGLIATAIVWLLTAAIALTVAIMIREPSWVRLASSFIGTVYLAWGIVYLYLAPSLTNFVIAIALAMFSIILIVSGAIGIAAGVVPANWLREAPRASTA